MEFALNEEKKLNIKRIFEQQKLNQEFVKAESVSKRKQKLKKLRETIEKYEVEVTDALQKDLRKPPFESLIWEVYLMYGEIEYALKQLDEWTQQHSVPSDFLKMMNSSSVIYEPRGVCLVIGPWNFPFQLAIGPLISAIAAGNCAIVKPPSMAPATSGIIAKIVSEAFNENEVAVIEGDSSVATELLSLNFDHIFFTGSPSVGKIVMGAAAKHLTSVTLELGGKSPTIIDKGANLKKAAAKISWGKFANSGQTCVAPDYVFVHEEEVDKFIQLIKQSIEDKYFKNGSINKVDYCKMINDRNFERVKKLYDEAVDKGAKVAYGGTFEKDDCTVHPTILTDIPADAEIMREEIFGPILPVITYKNLYEVTNHINNNDKPLAFYIFSRNNNNIKNIISKTTSGGVCVNDVVIHYTNPNLPFGGVNTSGIGSSHGFNGFKAFSHERAIMKQSVVGDLNNMVYPPYEGTMKEITRVVYKKFV